MADSPRGIRPRHHTHGSRLGDTRTSIAKTLGLSFSSSLGLLQKVDHVSLLFVMGENKPNILTSNLA